MTGPGTGILIDAAKKTKERLARIAAAAEASDLPEYRDEFYREVAELLEGHGHGRAARIVGQMQVPSRD